MDMLWLINIAEVEIYLDIGETGYILIDWYCKYWIRFDWLILQRLGSGYWICFDWLIDIAEGAVAQLQFGDKIGATCQKQSLPSSTTLKWKIYQNEWLISKKTKLMDDIQQTEWTIFNKQNNQQNRCQCQKQPLPSHFEKIISGRKKQLL